MSLFTATFRPLLARVVRAELENVDYLHLDRPAIERVLRKTWRLYEAEAPTLPEESTPGARLNVRLAALTLAVYRAVRAEGVSADDTRRGVTGAVWRVSRWWGVLPDTIARTVTRDSLRRLRICTDLFRRFPFNPPGYIMEDLPDVKSVAFDVRRCSVAEYFLREGEGAVCQEAWCDQDFPLARMWDGRLDRTMTIAEGCTHCNFRWRSAKVER